MFSPIGSWHDIFMFGVDVLLPSSDICFFIMKIAEDSHVHYNAIYVYIYICIFIFRDIFMHVVSKIMMNMS